MKKLHLLLALSTLSAYAASRIDLPAGNEAEAKGIFKISAAWIKDKGKKFDINISMQNLSDTGEIIFSNAIECYRNSVRGELKYTFFNTGERNIDFKPGETKSSNFVCVLNSEQAGEEYKIVVKNVYANKTLDGKTVSEKPLLKEIVWTQKFINGLPATKN